MRLDHIQLAIPEGSEDKCRLFWQGLLGFSEIEKPKALQARGGIWFRCDTVEIHLGVEKEFRPAAKAHPAFSVSNIDETAQNLASHGWSVDWDEAILGRRRFFTKDAVGNRVEFLQGNL
ncbi:MAG: VOC family protein [Marinosulfonomonas sp.]